MQLADLTAEPDVSGRLTVHRSRTDQEGKGTVLYVGEATMRSIRRGDRVEPSAITDRAARSIIQTRAADVGIEGRVSGHSLRIGAAQSLSAAGTGLIELRQAGRRESPSMPAHYAPGQLAAQGSAAARDPAATPPHGEGGARPTGGRPPCCRATRTTAGFFSTGGTKLDAPPSRIDVPMRWSTSESGWRKADCGSRARRTALRAEFDWEPLILPYWTECFV